MLHAAFASPVSENDYHDIVRCIRIYEASSEDRSIEPSVLAEKGWPPSYDVCAVAERLRFAFVFQPLDNPAVQALVARFDRCQCEAPDFVTERTGSCRARPGSVASPGY